MWRKKLFVNIGSRIGWLSKKGIYYKKIMGWFLKFSVLVANPKNYFMCDHHIIKDQPGKVADPARGQQNREN